MLPESYAPPLEHYDAFKAFMSERGYRSMRDYVPETEVEGELLGDFWTVVITAEEKLPDGRLYCQMLDVGERAVLTGDERLWSIQADLLATALKHGIRDA